MSDNTPVLDSEGTQENIQIGNNVESKEEGSGSNNNGTELGGDQQPLSSNQTTDVGSATLNAWTKQELVKQEENKNMRDQST